jgi:hypothetical protein
MEIPKLQQQARLSFDQAVAKRNLQERMQARLNVSFNGGFFTVTKEQMLFLHHNHYMGLKYLIILDDYETPIRVDCLDLYTIMAARYQEIMNEWEEEWQRIKKTRRGEDV